MVLVGKGLGSLELRSYPQHSKSNDLPDNVSDVIDVVPIVTRKDARYMAGYRFQDQRSSRPHERLGSWD